MHQQWILCQATAGLIAAVPTLSSPGLLLLLAAITWTVTLVVSVLSMAVYTGLCGEKIQGMWQHLRKTFKAYANIPDLVARVTRIEQVLDRTLDQEEQPKPDPIPYTPAMLRVHFKKRLHDTYLHVTDRDNILGWFDHVYRIYSELNIDEFCEQFVAAITGAYIKPHEKIVLVNEALDHALADMRLQPSATRRQTVPTDQPASILYAPARLRPCFQKRLAQHNGAMPKYFLAYTEQAYVMHQFDWLANNTQQLCMGDFLQVLLHSTQALGLDKLRLVEQVFTLAEQDMRQQS